MTDEEALGKWFKEVTEPQLKVYNERMAVAAAYRGSPRWARIQQAASQEMRETTAEATRLYEIAMSEIIAVGEVSEETDAILTQFTVGQIMAENPLAPYADDLAVISKLLARA
jgi:hypothetical protein